MKIVITADKDSKYFDDVDTELPMNTSAICYLCGEDTSDDARLSFIAEFGDGIISSKKSKHGSMLLLDFHVDCFFIKFLDKGFNRFLNVDYIKKLKMKKLVKMV